MREAHAADEWQMESNVKDDVVFNQPKSLEDRRTAAQKCCAATKLAMPCVVDTVDDHVDDLYAAWPERMYVIDAAGRIIYAGKQGPWGFKPEEVEKVLARLP